ncbi:MAG: hypothetical protein WCQ59_09940 [Candidatus Cloacimonadaceae bacterium]
MENSSPAEWNIIFVLKTGQKYDIRHARSIYNEVTNNVKGPYKFWCLTDQAETFGCTRIPLVRNWPGWFSKLELFRPDLGVKGGILYLDLACIFGHPLELPQWDKVLTPGRLFMWKDPWSSVTPYASGIMAWIGNTVTAPYTDFLLHPVFTNPSVRIWGDQNIINTSMPGKIDDIKAFLDVKSFKAHHIKDRKEADIIAFHGRPKPWDIDWSTVKL